jgi:hypothetical protein
VAGLDLGQVQDVVDQLEQVAAGRVDRPGELHLLAGQVPLGVVGQHLGQHQRAVQRGTQLVRHVGHELGLVLRRDGQLPGAVLQLLAGLLDLEVLHLDVAVLPGQQRRLLGQLGVRALQLVLLLLQLLGQALGLGEQRLGPLVGQDRVQPDADRLLELLEQVLVHLGEPVHGGQLDHAERPALEQQRQHDHVDPVGGTQA